MTFQMDIQDVVTSLMPGLMMSFPGMGKLRAAGAVAAAASQGGYFTFKAASLESAYDVKRTYYRLYFLDEKIRVNRENLGLLQELERLARSQNEVGKATLQDVLRAQIEQERLNNEIANLEDSRAPLLAQWKAALGIEPNDPTPPVPARFESTPLDVAADKCLEQARRRTSASRPGRGCPRGRSDNPAGLQGPECPIPASGSWPTPRCSPCGIARGEL